MAQKQDNRNFTVMSLANEGKCTSADVMILCKAVQDSTIEAINWYLHHKEMPKRLSQWFRGLALSLGAVGGLIPLLPEEWISHMLPKPAGFFFLGLATAIVVFDNYFGFSKRWMRYMATHMRLRKLLCDFQMDWASLYSEVNGNANPDPVLTQRMLRRIKTFYCTVLDVMDEEMQTWIRDFSASLARMEHDLHQPGEALQSVSITVRIPNVDQLDDKQAEIRVDGVPRQKTGEKAVTLDGLTPGRHAIEVVGMVRKQPVSASAELVLTNAGGNVVELSPSDVTAGHE